MVKPQLTMRYRLRMFSAVALAALLSACASNGHNVQTTSHAVKDQNEFMLQAPQDEFEQLVRSVDVKSRIMNQYADWKGVRYRLGGSDKRGIDCSAFVQLTFLQQFGLNLPRSTSKQKESGRSIKKNRLLAGDLVLFRVGSTGRHVGIYLGNDNFVHASTRSGVMISNLNDTYWKKHYREARRVLGRKES